ncbi:MAG: hypothetical protein M1822_004598 [Bathelium mastoideum]|nr:MAG: hypothetical protein M1822_004598 [Bathelium mastoideum]
MRFGFVSRKITMAVAKIACHSLENFALGNLDAKRDWGHAEDYVDGMYKMLQHPQADDFVLATEESRSVREFATEAFKVVGINLSWSGKGAAEVGYDEKTQIPRVFVDQDLYRPLDVVYLQGSAEKAKRKLKWSRKRSFSDLVHEMVHADIKLLQSNCSLSSATSGPGPML